MDISLIEWLRIPCLPEELSELPWNKNIKYLSIDSVKDKIQFMNENFKTEVNYFDLVVTPFFNPAEKDFIYNSTVRLTVNDYNGFFASLVGAATFSTGQYKGNYQYAGIAKSLAIVNALSSEFEQFGKNVNKENAIPDMTDPSSKDQKIISKSLHKAIKQL